MKGIGVNGLFDGRGLMVAGSFAQSPPPLRQAPPELRGRRTAGKRAPCAGYAAFVVNQDPPLVVARAHPAQPANLNNLLT